MKALAQMHACETSLLHTDFKRHPELLELMLASDFYEISAAGRSDRSKTVAFTKRPILALGVEPVRSGRNDQ